MAQLEADLRARADPRRAMAMAAYMKGRFPFYGIYSAGVAEIGHGRLPAELDVLAFAEAAWARDQREWQYLGLRTLLRDQGRLGPDALPRLEQLIVTRAWWDTVDGLA